MMKEKFNVGGMTCSACQAHVEKSVNALQGIASVEVNLLLNNMVVEYRRHLFACFLQELKHFCPILHIKARELYRI